MKLIYPSNTLYLHDMRRLRYFDLIRSGVFSGNASSENRLLKLIKIHNEIINDDISNYTLPEKFSHYNSIDELRKYIDIIIKKA